MDDDVNSQGEARLHFGEERKVKVSRRVGGVKISCGSSTCTCQAVQHIGLDHELTTSMSQISRLHAASNLLSDCNRLVSSDVSKHCDELQT